MVEDERIAFVGSGGQLQPHYEQAERWELPNLTLMPGLIDAHVHLLADPNPQGQRQPEELTNSAMALTGAKHAQLTLEAGFTTVRDMAAVNEPIFALRRATAQRTIAGPRIVASGKCLTITGGHGSEYGVPMAWEVDGAAEFLKAVRKQIKAGADFIKVIATRTAMSSGFRGSPAFTVEEMRPGIEEAHAAGLLVAAHALASVEGLRNAVLAGVDHIEHGSPADDSTLDTMAARETALLPTLCFWDGLTEADRQGAFPMGNAWREKLSQAYENAMDTVRRANEKGVPIALGSDAGNPMDWHGNNALELALLVRAGLSPMQAIVAATKRAADVCGKGQELGTIEAGKMADLIAVEGNPLKAPGVLQDRDRIRLVMKAGRIVINRGVAPIG